jgi:rhodanese-related sulfurtransferase
MKSLRHLCILSVAATLSLAGCDDGQKDPETAADPVEGFSVTHVDAIAASQLLSSNPDIVVLDVRTPAEHAEGHLPGKVVNVDFKSENFREEAAKLDRDTSYLLHCRSGSRSTASLAILEELGFKKIHHLDGGIMAWTESGEAVEK